MSWDSQVRNYPGVSPDPRLPGMQYQRQWCQEKPLLWEAVDFWKSSAALDGPSATRLSCAVISTPVHSNPNFQRLYNSSLK